MQEVRTILWVIGDPSDDGHGKTDTYSFKTNLSKEDFLKINYHLYKEWKFALDRVFDNEYEVDNYDNCLFANYEQNQLTDNQFKVLKDKGFHFWNNDSNDPEAFDFYTDEFKDLIIFCIIKAASELGMENVVFESFEIEYCPLSGGYGLFW